MLAQATLRNGSTVPTSLLPIIWLKLKELEQENIFALWDLAMKCKYMDHSFAPLAGSHDPLSTLQKYTLVDANENVHPDIKEIILNSIASLNRSEAGSIVLRHPLADPLPESNKRRWCFIL